MSKNDNCIKIQDSTSINTQQAATIPIVFFGRLEERKGLCTFIEAIKLLEPELKQKVQIIFMGKVVPLYSAELKHLNSEQYIQQELDESIKYQIISNFYSQQAIQYISDLANPIVCLTSPQENFPNTALEMGQLPVTIIASDTGGFRETLQLVQRQEGIYWFKPKDADSLSLRLAEAITNYPETPQVIAKSTLEGVNEKLLIDKINRIEAAFLAIKPTSTPTSKVTIGVICHQQGESLIDCLSSIEAQTYPNLEVIVLEDGSKDNHSQAMFIHAQSLFPQFKFIQQETYRGLGATRNQIISLASGDYFLFLNPKVILFPFAVEKFLITASHTNAAIVTSAQKEIGAVNRIVNYQGGTLPTLMLNNLYCGECCLFSCDILSKFPFTESKEINTQTWEVIAAALVTGAKIVYYPYPLYEYLTTTHSPTHHQPNPRERYSLRQYLAQIPPAQWAKRQLYLLLSAVQQLQDLPPQMSNLQWQLHQKTEELKQSQFRIQELEQHLQAHQPTEIEQKWQQSQAELAHVHQQIEQLSHELHTAEERISAMETSKFWKIRQKWFKFKQNLGLPTNE